MFSKWTVHDPALVKPGGFYLDRQFPVLRWTYELLSDARPLDEGRRHLDRAERR
jgi:hypothetical protein